MVDDWAAFVASVRVDKTYADNLSIVAAAELYGVNISITCDSREMDHIVRPRSVVRTFFTNSARRY